MVAACGGVVEAPTEFNPPPTLKTPVSFSSPLSQPSIKDQPPDRTEAQVVHVVDGDTIDVRIDGKEYRVRYIGIDTPETVHPTRGEEPYGREASNRNKQLVSGQTVYLEQDVSETDRYGRLLSYVWLDDAPTTKAVQVLLPEPDHQLQSYLVEVSLDVDLAYLRAPRLRIDHVLERDADHLVLLNGHHAVRLSVQ